MSRNPDRFLGRAAVYAAARPPYPAALGEWLAAEGLLRGDVADLGAGTGLFTRLLLSAGAARVAVPHSPARRRAAVTAPSRWSSIRGPRALRRPLARQSPASRARARAAAAPEALPASGSHRPGGFRSEVQNAPPRPSTSSACARFTRACAS